MSQDKSQEYHLVAFENASDGEQATWRALERAVGLQATEGAIELFHFDVPKLRVGTLEKTMSSSDLLGKVDVAIESTIRKIERAYAEAAQDAGDALAVEGQTPTQYVQGFRWAAAKYQPTRSIEDIVKACQQSVGKIDDELKQAMATYQEAKAVLAAAQRKRGGGLMGNVADALSKLDPKLFVYSEYLTTLSVVVGKTGEEQFLDEYEAFASEAVGYGPPENRQAVLGSPVVPKSARRVGEEAGYALYTFVALRAFASECVQDAQRKRYAVKEWIPPSVRAAVDGGDAGAGAQASGSAAAAAAQEGGGGAGAAATQEIDAAQAERDLANVRGHLRNWAKTHYGEAFVAWMHIKCVRVFVEAVLMYGLPVNFVAALVKPLKRAQDKKLRQGLVDALREIKGKDAILGGLGEDDPADAAALAGPAAAEAKQAFYPYVSFTFKPLSE